MTGTDLLQSFIEENLEFSPDARIAAGELHRSFNGYAVQRGHREWTERTFVARFADRVECTRNDVQCGRFRHSDGSGGYRAWTGVRFRRND